MKMQKNAVALVALAAAAGAAQADVSMRFIETGVGRNVAVTLNGETNNFFSGQLVHEIDNAGSPTLAVNGRVNTFCVELTEHTSGNFDTFHESTLDDEPIPAVTIFMGARTQAVLDAAVQFYDTAASQDASANEASAFQLLLWEIVYDYDPNVGLSSIDPTSGNVSFTKTDGNPLWSGVSNLITSFSAAIGAESGSRDFTLLTNDGKQDQIVPAPGTMALLGGVALMGTRRRRA